MASISNIKIKNFRAYRDAEIDFEGDNGVYLISGDNGAGKSTFLNAINWCLYGDTPFQSVGNQAAVASDGMGDDDVVSVQIYLKIGNDRYSFTRVAQGSSQSRGKLIVQREIDGNWRTLDSVVEAPDAVKRVLPKEIRHLFFFNGEQLRDIYTNDGKEHNLKQNVYKVAEIDVLDKAIEHLKLLEDRYLRKISKNSKNTAQIEGMEKDIKSSEAVLRNFEKNIQEYKDGLAVVGQKISDLDIVLRDTREARLLLERRDGIEKQLKLLDDRISGAESTSRDIIQKYLAQALLHDKFLEYYEALVEAEKKSLIPPPIDPKITQQILEEGICICGMELTPEARARIEKQNEEYLKSESLRHLSDGIRKYRDVNRLLPELRHSFVDAQNDLLEYKSKRDKLRTELAQVNEQLGRLDEAVQELEKNPDISRENYIKRQRELEIKLRGALDSKDETEKAIKRSRDDLAKLIKKEDNTREDEIIRQRAEYLGEKMNEIKSKMEEITRKQLQENTWETFSKILPDSMYDGLKIDESYNISLFSKDGRIRTVNMASTGEVKALGLSLVSALSNNLGGYSSVPLLIDNLYGDLSESHFKELTSMVSRLSRDKQVVIMNLDIERVESEFDDSVVRDRFRLLKDPNNGTEIVRYCHE